ncbi:CDP-alcohol phosphatidyltransferase family protein [Roseiconus nitratireducens]|nr:CDP-alcohol phosphatidyltransferase family protein [Roseiconus nitratireducens]
MTNNPIEGRRPVKSRRWPIFRRLAGWLSETRITPNTISVSSGVFGCLAGILLAGTSWTSGDPLRLTCYIAAAVMIQFRLIANLLDGMVAVEGGKSSPVGGLFNEVPDRISDVAVLVGAGYSLSAIAPLGYAAALVALFVAYVRAVGGSEGVGQCFQGPMAKPQRMAIMTAACLACGLAILLGAAAPAIAILMNASLSLIVAGGAVTAWRRLSSIAQRMREQHVRTV